MGVATDTGGSSSSSSGSANTVTSGTTSSTGTTTGSDTEDDTKEVPDTDGTTGRDTDGTSDSDTDTGGATCEPACEGGQACIEATCLDQEPAYPRRTAEGCPRGFLENNTSNTCLAPCDVRAPNNVAACPQASSGDAVGFCVLGGEVGVGGACDTYGIACEMEGEFCIDNQGMGLACVAPTHCILFCGAGRSSCPSSMMCSDQGICVYG